MAKIDEIQNMMVESFVPEKASGMEAVVQFELSGDEGGTFALHINDGAVETSGGVDDPKTTVKASVDDWIKIAKGELNVMQAFMTGRVKVGGDMGLATKLQSLFKIG